MKQDFPKATARFMGIGYAHAPDGLPLVAFDRSLAQTGPDELLVHVVASSLNPLDYKLADRNFLGRTPPVVLGFDVARRGSDAVRRR